MNDTDTDENIYSGPKTSPENMNEIPSASGELASLGSRLGGAILDSLISLVILLPIMYFSGGFSSISDPESQTTFLYSLMISIVGFITVLAINYKFLVSSGQTIGKKIVGTKIVTMEGELPTMKGHFLIRLAIYLLPSNIPVVGQLFPLVNACFIFGKERRCIHDLVAKTKVVNVLKL